MWKAPTRIARNQIEETHLNLTPFIDIMVCLVLFLLSSTAVLKLSVLDTTLPRLAEGQGVQSPEDDKVAVIVQIRQGGFRVGRVGKDRIPKRQQLWEANGSLQGSLGRASDGEFDYAGLVSHLQRIKQVYPASTSILFLPAESIPYQVVIEAMDAVREVREGAKRVPLFPEAVLGHLPDERG